MESAEEKCLTFQKIAFFVSADKLTVFLVKFLNCHVGNADAIPGIFPYTAVTSLVGCRAGTCSVEISFIAPPVARIEVRWSYGQVFVSKRISVPGTAFVVSYDHIVKLLDKTLKRGKVSECIRFRDAGFRSFVKIVLAGNG